MKTVSPLYIVLALCALSSFLGCVSDLDFDEIAPDCQAPRYDLPDRDVFCGTEVQSEVVQSSGADGNTITAMDVGATRTLILRSVFQPDNLRRSKAVFEIVDNSSLINNPDNPTVILSKEIDLSAWASLSEDTPIEDLDQNLLYMVFPWTQVTLLDEESGFAVINSLFGWQTIQLDQETDWIGPLRESTQTFDALNTTIQCQHTLSEDDLPVNFPTEFVSIPATDTTPAEIFEFTPILTGLRVGKYRKNPAGRWERVQEYDDGLKRAYQDIQEFTCEFVFNFENPNSRNQDSFECYSVSDYQAALDEEPDQLNQDYTVELSTECIREGIACHAEALQNQFTKCASDYFDDAGKAEECTTCTFFSMCDACEGCAGDPEDDSESCRLFCNDTNGGNTDPEDTRLERQESCEVSRFYRLYEQCNRCEKVDDGTETSEECYALCRPINSELRMNAQQNAAVCDAFIHTCDFCESDDVPNVCSELCDDEGIEFSLRVLCIDQTLDQNRATSILCSEYETDVWDDDCHDDALECECLRVAQEEFLDDRPDDTPSLNIFDRIITSVAVTQNGSDSVVYIGMDNSIRVLPFSSLGSGEVITNLANTIRRGSGDIPDDVILDNQLKSLLLNAVMYNTVQGAQTPTEVRLPNITNDPEQVPVAMKASSGALYVLLVDLRLLTQISDNPNGNPRPGATPTNIQDTQFHLARYPLDGRGNIVGTPEWITIEKQLSGVPFGSSIETLNDNMLAVRISQLKLDEAVFGFESLDFSGLNQPGVSDSQTFWFDVTQFQQGLQPFLVQTHPNNPFVWNGFGSIQSDSSPSASSVLEATEDGLQTSAVRPIAQ